jgi:hypothetical protein
VIEAGWHVQTVGAARKVSSVDLVTPEVFHVLVTRLRKLRDDFLWRKEQSEGFAGRGYSALYALKHDALQKAQ